jgi:hypothetical protein
MSYPMIGSPRSLDNEFKRLINVYANMVEPPCRGLVTGIGDGTLTIYIGEYDNPRDDITHDVGLTLRDVPVIVPIVGSDDMINITLGEYVYLVFVGGHISQPIVIGKALTHFGGD